MSDYLNLNPGDLAAEQVREAYERGLEDAARVAEVKPRKGGRPLSGPHHAGIRRGRSEAARLIRALKSNDTNGGRAMTTPDTTDHKCPRCGTPLKIVEVRVPIVVEAQDAPVSFTRYETREEAADCPRCTGGY